MFNLEYNSIELQQFCEKLSKKNRVHWINMMDSNFTNEITAIKNSLSISNTRQFIYHILNDISTLKKCSCGNTVSWDTGQSKWVLTV